MKASGISLVDANVWLAIALDGHVHHAAALAWFDGQAEGTCAFCRITQLAFLRHLTNPKIMGAANVRSHGTPQRGGTSVFLDSGGTSQTRPTLPTWYEQTIAHCRSPFLGHSPSSRIRA
jgi:predicted nucleic acid-binding protein